MKANPVTPAATEINRLHAEVRARVVASRDALNDALAAAWQAGQLLLAERAQVNKTMLRGAWPLWVRRNFEGSLKTARRYMQLAQSVSDLSCLRGLSLRQAYFRLGIATEPKKSGRHAVARLPDYVRLATRLVAVLNRRRGPHRAATPDHVRRDLRPLYERLRIVFAENQPPVRVSKGP